MSRNTVDPSLLKKPQKYFEAIAADIVNIKEQLATSEKRSDKTDKENAELQARFEKIWRRRYRSANFVLCRSPHLAVIYRHGIPFTGGSSYFLEELSAAVLAR
ncbi:hypothetical protein TrLO_g12570 [Triparma laevis f. longispina]|uniref:Uncharacterized protein n=1 Tax=Triparma laevis f. longispina TaxID=1714387 RepID=A0A9W7DX42_9STRA|nr:hypothetical protein TrLO_g12570 [Triparma laevis f. longispina]